MVADLVSWADDGKAQGCQCKWWEVLHVQQWLMCTVLEQIGQWSERFRGRARWGASQAMHSLGQEGRISVATTHAEVLFFPTSNYPLKLLEYIPAK